MGEFPAPPKVHVMWVPGADPQRDAIVRQLQVEGQACLHTDDDRNGCMWNWLGAMDCAAANDSNDPWSIVLSDDAMPLPGWQQHVERACKYSPQPLLGLTHFGGYGEKALEKGAPYGVGQYLIWGGAVAYHRSIVAGLAGWARKVQAETGYQHDDCLASAYALRQGFKCALTARAIFDQPVKKSLLNHNTPIRRPNTTIENTDGPSYSASPRFIKVHKQVWDEIKELATHG